MALAFRLARRGLNTTDPNPRVGCVIADGERVVATGWHETAGGAHAEIAALNAAGEPVRGMTAYITLEPCAFHGRTPPCAEALVKAGLGRVVVSVEDPHPRVAGKGLQRLREAGIAVESGLLSAQGEALNPGFLKRMRTGRPWLRIKSAVSLDGRIGLANGESQWISGEASRRDVQRWRARSSAILTGIGTVLADDPRMTARIAGPLKQPLRVVVDSRWRTPADCRILSAPGETLLAGVGPPPGGIGGENVRCLSLPAGTGGVDLRALLEELGKCELNEVQVEAGSRLCGALHEAGLVDELLLYVAPVMLGDGGPGPVGFGPLESMADRAHFRILDMARLGADIRIRLQPRPDPSH